MAGSCSTPASTGFLHWSRAWSHVAGQTGCTFMNMRMSTRTGPVDTWLKHDKHVIRPPHHAQPCWRIRPAVGSVDVPVAARLNRRVARTPSYIRARV
eukprot:359362-Chlamydomonas_euryale.AAC.6